MKDISYLFLNLNIILGILPGKTRYVLIEVAKDQEPMISSKGVLDCPPSRETGECNSKPEFIPIIDGSSTTDGVSTNAVSCTLDKRYWCQGNHIEYEVGRDESHIFLKVRKVDAEYCKPKPEDCHCKAMLKMVLARHPEVNRIDGYFNANPFMKGCGCYLGQAAIAGFSLVGDDDIESTERIEFTKENYVQVCKKLQKSNLKEGFAKIYKEID